MLEVEAALSESGERDATLVIAFAVEEQRVVAHVERGERVADALGNKQLVEHLLVERVLVGEYVETELVALIVHVQHVLAIDANRRTCRPGEQSQFAPSLAHFHTRKPNISHSTHFNIEKTKRDKKKPSGLLHCSTLFDSAQIAHYQAAEYVHEQVGGQRLNGRSRLCTKSIDEWPSAAIVAAHDRVNKPSIWRVCCC